MWPSPSHLRGEDMASRPPSSHFPGRLANMPVLLFVLLSKGFIQMWAFSPVSPGSSHTHHRRPGTHGWRYETGSTLNWLHSLGQVASALTKPRFITGEIWVAMPSP